MKPGNLNSPTILLPPTNRCSKPHRKIIQIFLETPTRIGDCLRMSNTEQLANPIPENKVGSREFEESMQVFETTLFKSKPVRESRDSWKYGAFYADGVTNAHFKGFLNGIAYARSLANLA